MLFSLCFCQKIHIKRLLMTIITLYHLFFGPCVNSSVIVLVVGIFSLGAVLPQKNTSAQNDHLWFSHNDLKKDDAQLLLSNSCRGQFGIKVRLGWLGTTAACHYENAIIKTSSYDLVPSLYVIVNSTYLLVKQKLLWTRMSSYVLKLVIACNHIYDHKLTQYSSYEHKWSIVRSSAPI